MVIYLLVNLQLVDVFHPNQNKVTKEQIKEYIEDNKERIKESNKQWREENKDVLKEKKKKYVEDHHEELKAKKKEEMICECCGKTYKRSHKSDHLKSKYHLNNKKE